MHLSTICTTLLLGCAAASGAATVQDGDRLPGGEPIRYGDKDGHAYGRPLLPGKRYDPSVPHPDAVLGQAWGTRIASHDEVLRAVRAMAAASPRATLQTHGRSHEGQELVHLVITSEANHERLAQLREGLARLHDPRGLSEPEGERLAAELPAVAYMGYGIHGDETSATEAAPLVVYHLLAGQDEEVEALLDDVIVVLDPCMNPDGRGRIRAMTRWMSGYRSNLDHVSLHRGRWPWGRGNHYLFDMNRDWMAGVCPETRARWELLREWPPHLFVDAHEMGSLDTFLFYPQEKPHNPSLPPYLIGWQDRFGDDMGAAFDAFGWGYYTREWADAWAPFYSDSWGSLGGAIGMLYEQAGIGGQPIRRRSGVVETYAESVHGQVVASLANLETLRAHRTSLLADYLADRRACVAEDTSRAVVLPGPMDERLRDLHELLEAQGVEVHLSERPFEGTDVVAADGARAESREFPKGALVIRLAQPARRRVLAYFDLDPRIDAETLADERARLERDLGSRLYDMTAWDLARQFGVEAAWCDVEASSLVLLEALPPSGDLLLDAPIGPDKVAYAVDCRDDVGLRFLARALELGLAVHVSDRPFEVGGQELARGSYLLRRHENPPEFDALVARALEAVGDGHPGSHGVQLHAATTARAAGDTPDLGGQHFHLLRGPRVAMLTGEPCSSSDFGHLWHHLDANLRVPVTLLEARDLGSYDLRPYDVLVLPPASGLGETLDAAGESLDAWIQAGGTLIACGSSAGAIAARGEWTDVRRRRDVLDDLEGYLHAAEEQRTAGTAPLDLDEIWGDGEAVSAEAPAEEAAAPSTSGGHPDADRRDAAARRFMPTGAILRAATDPHHWLTAGCGPELPVLFRGSTALLLDGRAPVRLAAAERVRLAGLVWPEARARLGGAVWASQEGRGHGQVILFATNPVFRGSTRATARLFTNAVLLGPGLGADPVMGR